MSTLYNAPVASCLYVSSCMYRINYLQAMDFSQYWKRSDQFGQANLPTQAVSTD